MINSLNRLDDKRALQNVFVLAFAQATLGAQLPMVFILGGLAGHFLSTKSCLATLPVSMTIIGSTITAPFLSIFMQKYGRRIGFVVGTLHGGVGAAICSYGIFKNSFVLFLLGSLITGVYMASYGFYRFAAADTARLEFRPKAISYVVAAGLVSAILGPQMVKLTLNQSVYPFLGSYIAIVVLNLLGLFIFLFLDIPVQKSPKKTFDRTRTVSQLLSTRNIRVAMVCAMIAYASMTLMMTATPLAVVGCGYSQKNAADVVMVHVLAMSVPSFFTGHLILFFGIKKILLSGMLILLSSALVGTSGTNLSSFFFALTLLGVGWNFTFIAATTLLANSHALSERGKTQGINDMFVFGFVALASLASGILMNCSGGSSEDGWELVNIAIVPLVTISIMALTIIALKSNEQNNSRYKP